MTAPPLCHPRYRPGDRVIAHVVDVDGDYVGEVIVLEAHAGEGEDATYLLATPEGRRLTAWGHELEISPIPLTPLIVALITLATLAICATTVGAWAFLTLRGMPV